MFSPSTETILSDLRALVEFESPSDDPARVSELAAWIVGRLRSDGVAAEAIHLSPRGDAVRASIGPPDVAGTLLLGHLDTVWPVGTIREIPFRAEGGRIFGPGVFDMKAGIAVMMSVLPKLSTRSSPPSVTLLLTPDEEVGSASSRELLVAEARKNRQVLVLEPSVEGRAKIARKGTGVFRARFDGIAAHAGLEPEKGASALSELSRFVLFLDSLGDTIEGTTVTPTQARAGTKSNVVPERAELTVDARIWSSSEARRIERAIEGYRPADPRVVISITGAFERPPMEETPASKALFEKARTIAARFGFDLGGERVGGASDGNLTAAAGVPTLDGLGPAGDGAHARHEFVFANDLGQRAALLEALLEELI